MPSKPRCVALFARWPGAGRVKSRLSPVLPDRELLVLYHGMLTDAMATIERAAASRRTLFWADPPPPDAAVPPGWEWKVQDGADLGERLENAFGDLLREPPGRAVIVGADCPELDSPTIDRAFREMDHADVVLGPANDGGYYLVGLSEPLPIFEGIPWGTTEVLERTDLRAARLGLQVALLEPLDDVDRPEDLVGLIARLARGPNGCPHTRAALRELRLLP